MFLYPYPQQQQQQPQQQHFSDPVVVQVPWVAGGAERIFDPPGLHRGESPPPEEEEELKEAKPKFSALFDLEEEKKFSHEEFFPVSPSTEPCPTCTLLVPTPDLIQHIRNHMGPRRCEVCSYEAPTKHHLREHMNTHTGLKPYKCNYCEKSFAAKNSLRVHTMYLHTKVRSHQCRFCEQRFVTTSERKSHELVHTDKCPVCGMSFRLRGHLRQHMRVHSLQGQQTTSRKK